MLADVASSILEGANANSSISLYGDYDYTETMVGESSFLASACATLYTDILEAHQKYQETDIVATARLIQESKTGNAVTEATIAAVTEGVFKSAIDKLIASFKKFIAKIKEIYGKIIKWFKVMMADSETFINDYGDEVKTKAGKVKGYSYQGYKFQRGAGDSAVTKATDACSAKIKEMLGNYDVKSDASKSKDEWKAQYSSGSGSSVQSNYDDTKDDNLSASEVVDEFMESNKTAFCNASDSAELRKELLSIYHDDATAKSVIKDFEAASVVTMIKFLKDSKKNISDIESIVSKYENKVNAVIKKLNGISGKEDGSEDKLVSRINYISQIISQLLTLYRVPYDVKTQVYKEMTTEYLGALKGFLRYKGTSESTIMDEASLLADLPMACFEGTGKDDDDLAGPDEGDNKPVGEATNLLDDILNTVYGMN